MSMGRGRRLWPDGYLERMNASRGISLRGVFSLCFWFLLGFLVGGASLVSSPAGADSLSLVLPKESKQRNARPRWRLPLEFMSQGGRGGKLAALRQPPLFFLPATEIQGAI